MSASIVLEHSDSLPMVGEISMCDQRIVDSRRHNADLLDKNINRRETLVNSHSLMAGYIEAMNNWKADEQELNEKRQSLSTRLEQIKQQAVEDMAKARQAETDAATAYAQAAAWGDTEAKRPPTPMRKKSQKTWQPLPNMIVDKA